MKKILVAVSLVVCLTLSVRSEDPPQGTEPVQKVRACGLQIVGKGYGAADDNDSLRPLNAFGSGTSVALLVTPGAGTLIQILTEECKVMKFVDDKGTDLLKGDMRFGEPGFSFGAQISKDGKAAMMEVRGPGLPSPEATSFTLEGTTAFMVSATGKTETVKAENAEMKKDAKFTAGTMTFTVREAGKPQWGEDPLAIDISCKTSLEALKSVKFLDANGKEIESNRNSTSRESFGGDTTWAMSFTLKQNVEKATVVIESWADAKKLFVPVILKVKLGF
ncbi:MAG: hypothetical protein AAB074_17125 [Planctomycetota bacterium]